MCSICVLNSLGTCIHPTSNRFTWSTSQVAQVWHKVKEYPGWDGPCSGVLLCILGEQAHHHPGLGEMLADEWMDETEKQD